MGIFTRRDRIAIAVIAALILAGWTVKFTLYRNHEPDTVRVIRNAIKLPSPLDNPDSLGAGFPDLFAPVDINHADSGTLELLPMIGPVKAAAIIEYREHHGPFTDIADIMNVPGIGPATYERIRSRITVDSGSDNDER